MASTIEQSQSPYGSGRRDQHQHPQPDFNLREWALRAQISRENTKSRRFSGSHIRTSFREDARSFRSNITISSTPSSPGYPFNEIDPSTYSFTTALKALQARAGYNSWECLSPDGFALNSKWNEAEKYICNPLSGEVPRECLSAKTLSGRSFRNPTNRITMSAPLMYSTHLKKVQTKPSHNVTPDHDSFHFPIQEKKMEGSTRDVGTQSTPFDLSSSSPSPASTPPIMERLTLKRCEEEGGDSPNCNGKLGAEGKVIEEEETIRSSPSRKEEATKGEKEKEESKKKENEQMWRCSNSSSNSMQGGCLSWMRKRQREKHKPRNKRNICLLNPKGC
ncbi:uncharacterized protein LOC105638704 isoform X2 [Jatropha curcas]|uniref:uncharacterized protein LOC105638704 isoform X2 n=1 Tax=Jatropha curcas TaxID=180498 RepID=UPI0005FB6156|nr:uncharacterized protein LOC105638704 isoform X2 [Jatropha curcas]